VTSDSGDLSWLRPPATTSDPAAWDTFWRAQLQHPIALGFVDLFCRDGWLIDACRTAGLRSILCVGAGISGEPHALAAAGFDVMVLDLSPFVIDLTNQVHPPPEVLSGLLEGRTTHTGGHLQAVAGDLRDVTICPGPYDVVIERKTLQLFAEEERSAAVSAVAQRLGPRGIFFSHAHLGALRPGQSRTHPVGQWFEEQQWPWWNRQEPLDRRVVELFVSTG
jgi:hypothetical protein